MSIESELEDRMRKHAKSADDDEDGIPFIKIGLFGLAAILGISLIGGAYFTVPQTDVAGVTRFSKLISDQPLGPGLHFKLPFVEKVDYLQTSISKFGVNNLKVYTVDNQPITVNVNMTYQIPKSDAFHLMYDVGKSGDFDIWQNIEPVIAGAVAQIFSQENVVSISEDRAKLNTEITKQVQAAIGPTFGVNVMDLQITALGYGEAFEESIAQAVTAKNLAIKAQNKVNQIRFEADQAKIRAEGEAQAAIAKAEGIRQAAILEAKGKSLAIVMMGDAQAKAIEAVGTAVSANPQIVRYEVAKAWNGQTPRIVVGGKDGGAVPLLNLQVPSQGQDDRR